MEHPRRNEGNRTAMSDTPTDNTTSTIDSAATESAVTGSAGAKSAETESAVIGSAVVGIGARGDDAIKIGELTLRSESGPRSATRPAAVDGVLTLTAHAKADMFLDPAGFTTAPTAERFVDAVEGDFRLRAYVEVDFVSDYDSGVLLGFIDDENWFKICAELDPDGTHRVVSVVTRGGVSDDSNSWAMPDSGIHLRISRTGDAFAMHASADGTVWSMIRYFSMGAPAPASVKVGLLAQSPTGDGTSARFSEIAFTREPLAGVRSGA
jgi:regulation of enolase protein 1 (concanavalin A-like superfamily)